MAGILNNGRFVIGLTGPVGAGVSTVSDALKDHGFFQASISTPIKKELRKKVSLPATSIK